MKKNIKWNHYLNYIIIGALTVVFSAMSLTGTLSRLSYVLLQNISIAIILSVSLSVVVGFLGELSLGHAGFMCIGAYLGGKVSSLLLPAFGESLINVIISMAVGGILAAICGVIIGLPALRLRGDYLAIVTLAFGEIVRSIFMNSSPESFGGSFGLQTPRYDRTYLFIVGFVVVLICLAVIQNMMRSKHGRAITAIRDSEIAARATGINVTKYKLIVFTVSSFFAGVAGVLYSFTQSNVQSVNFSYNYSIEILVMVVLGGMGSINGAIISATLITFLDVQLQTILTGDLAVLQDFFYAIILIVIVIYNNAPGLKNFRDKYNFKNFTEKLFKKKNNPAHMTDDEAKWNRVPSKILVDEVLSTKIQRDPTASVKPDKEGK